MMWRRFCGDKANSVVMVAFLVLTATQAPAATSLTRDTRGHDLGPLRRLLAKAEAELEAVKAEIVDVERDIRRASARIDSLWQEYDATGDPRILKMIDLAERYLVVLKERLGELKAKAATLEQYIRDLKKRIQALLGPRPTTSKG